MSCHGAEKQKGNVTLHQIKDERSLLRAGRKWKDVASLVQSGEMPPEDASERPTVEERKRFLESSLAVFARADQAPPDPGRLTLRRLNRTEYNNTIRDLLHVDFRPGDNFPSDDVGYGFDISSTATGKSILESPLNGRDWLGFDDGARALPSGFPTNKIVRRGVFTPDVGYSPDEITAFGRGLDNTWQPTRKDGAPGQNWSAVFGNRFGKLGVIASARHAYKESYVDERRRFYRTAEAGRIVFVALASTRYREALGFESRREVLNRQFAGFPGEFAGSLEFVQPGRRAFQFGGRRFIFK